MRRGGGGAEGLGWPHTHWYGQKGKPVFAGDPSADCIGTVACVSIDVVCLHLSGMHLSCLCIQEHFTQLPAYCTYKNMFRPRRINCTSDQTHSAHTSVLLQQHALLCRGAGMEEEEEGRGGVYRQMFTAELGQLRGVGEGWS